VSRPVLSIAQLALERGRSDQVFRIDVPKLEVFPGDVVAVIGPSGCGKSTLLETIGLLLEARHAKQFLIDDIDINASMSLSPQKRETLWARIRQHGLGFVPQTGGLLPFLNVWDNICLPAKLSGASTVDPVVHSLVGRLNLESLLRRMPRELSIGERQRVSFVRALARRPTLLLADEPTAALDPSLAQELFTLIVEIATKEQIATLIVTHEWDLVDRFSLPRLSGHVEGVGRVVFHA
jgi:putative ABC transport system ATP-binding protein